jgi:hypothetical protein
MSAPTNQAAVPKPGSVQIVLGPGSPRRSLIADIRCLENTSYRVMLKESPLNPQYLISLLEPDPDDEAETATIVRELMTADLNRCFEVVETLMTHENPAEFCSALSLTFKCDREQGLIHLDTPSARMLQEVPS